VRRFELLFAFVTGVGLTLALLDLDSPPRDPEIHVYRQIATGVWLVFLLANLILHWRRRKVSHG
jgi:hypothetical protein